MAEERNGTIYYKRSRFLTHLPVGRLFTKSHYWLLEVEAGLWRAGMTKFASRMLGDIVEFGFEVKAGAVVSPGQMIGWIEGFKAISDVYCAGSGEFCRHNPALDANPSLIDADPYGEGWLYEIRGVPEAGALDVHGYVAILDATIDKMIGSRYDQKESVE